MNTSSDTTLNDHSRWKTGRPASVSTMIEDVLGRANDHEHREYQRYRLLCLRFLTYHIGISHLMQALAIECQQRVLDLIEVSRRLPSRQSPLRDPATGRWQELDIQPHFFIFDDQLAAQELSRALFEEWRSRRFYERLQAYNAIPGLHAWMNDCIGQCRAQFQILQEAQAQLPALTYPVPTREQDG